MSMICKWEMDENPLERVEIRYNLSEFHVLWDDGTSSYDENEKYKKVKQLINDGEEIFALYYKNDKPICMSKIVEFFDKDDFEMYKSKNKHLKKELDKHKVDDTVWLEKDFRLVNLNIEEFLTQDPNEEGLFHFIKEEYENYLEKNNIQYLTLTPNIMMDKKLLLEEIFIDGEMLDKIINGLSYKKNIILQGPPGVGKTFLAKKLAFLQMFFKDLNRVQMVQFHQSYSYEDFIQGYKPEPNGGFKLKNGVFYNFCKKAQVDLTHDYYFIIDEINRGNLSKIFGELMMLIETDKRGPEYSIPLTYSENGEVFYVPENIHIIGLMNTADRSLAVVDYALRRRFAFVNMEPMLDDKFINYLVKNNIKKELAEYISKKIKSLNQVIEDDLNLGKGFLIGHSYFCSNIDAENAVNWYNHIVENEVGPMLEEYWYDDLQKAYIETSKLLYKE